jgi:hypothetical protein
MPLAPAEGSVGLLSPSLHATLTIASRVKPERVGRFMSELSVDEEASEGDKHERRHQLASRGSTPSQERRPGPIATPQGLL